MKMTPAQQAFLIASLEVAAEERKAAEAAEETRNSE
jgi:hypothetical protein